MQDICGNKIVRMEMNFILRYTCILIGYENHFLNISPKNYGQSTFLQIYTVLVKSKSHSTLSFEELFYPPSYGQNRLI